MPEKKFTPSQAGWLREVYARTQPVLEDAQRRLDQARAEQGAALDAIFREMAGDDPALAEVQPRRVNGPRGELLGLAWDEPAAESKKPIHDHKSKTAKKETSS